VQALKRIFTILKVVIRYRLDDLFFAQKLPFWFALIRFMLPWRYLPRSQALERGKAIRLALQDLGPLFVKFGQILSTRRDLLAPDIASELALLQDRVPPFSSNEASKIIAEYLGCPISDCFAEFNATPIASASVAQVHGAKLKSGEEVIIKVVRPNLRPIIEADIAWLFLLAKMTQKLSARAKRLHLIEVISDYRNLILDELDLMREAANASQLRRNCANSKIIKNMIYIPKIYWEYCRPQLLVMERIYGLNVSDVKALKKAQIDLKTLAARGVEVFFTQVFYNSFFHADMHPGNIFVSPKNPHDPSYIAVDFGIMGSLTPEDQDYIARNLLAFFKRDYRKVVRLHINSGWVSPDVNTNDFEAAIRSVCEPIFARPLKEISFANLLLRLFQTARRFNMEVQPQLVLLQKTLLNIEGLGRQLYPDLNLWDTAAPFLEKWLKQRYCPKQIMAEVKEQLEYIPHLASRGKKIITQFENLQQKKAANNSGFWGGIVLITVAISCFYFELKIDLGQAILIGGGVYLLVRAKNGG